MEAAPILAGAPELSNISPCIQGSGRVTDRSTGAVNESSTRLYGGPEFVVPYSNGDKTSYVMTVFEGRTVGGALGPMDDESTEVAYFSEEELVALKAQPWVRVVLPSVFEQRGQAVFKPAAWKPGDGFVGTP